MLTALYKIFSPLFLKNSSSILGKMKKGLRQTENPDVTAHALRICAEHADDIKKLRAPKKKDTSHAVFELLTEIIFNDAEIGAQFRGMKIRHTAMCGAVIQKAMSNLGYKSDDIHLMSYGDVDLPDEFENTVLGIIARGSAEHMQLLMKYGSGYDLTSRGCIEARRALITYLDHYYGFTAGQVTDVLIDQCTIINGGMRALDDFAATFVHHAFLTQRRVRFISPDNSFPTWFGVVKNHTQDGALGDMYTLSTDPVNRLHLSADDVETFYGAFAPGSLKGFLDVWCVTPVGNPSGTAMTPEQLTQTIRAITKHNPDAVILMDCAYVRTMRTRRAKALMNPIFEDEDLRKNVVVLESFSKTHGLCGERIGCFFTTNKDLYTVLQNYNTTVSSGNGRYKDALAITLGTPTEAEIKSMKKLHRFWATERNGLYNYLMNDRFAELFERTQPHLTDEQLNEPLGIYVFLKLKKGVDVEQVFLKTRCLGVETDMGSGKYVRFAVCKLKEKTF